MQGPKFKSPPNKQTNREERKEEKRKEKVPGTCWLLGEAK